MRDPNMLEDYEAVCTALETVLRAGWTLTVDYVCRGFRVTLSRSSGAKIDHINHHWDDAIARAVVEAEEWDRFDDEDAYAYDDSDRRADTRLGLFLSRDEMRGRP